MSYRSLAVVDYQEYKPPCCPHGPTLLFKETNKEKVREFYACSAFRSRKDCHFYQIFEPGKRCRSEFKDTQFDIIPDKITCKNRLKEMKMKILICQSCGLLLQDSEQGSHQKHSSIESFDIGHLQYPTKLFKTLDSAKSFAQYWFSSETVEFIINSLLGIGYERFLCIGAPRIHEYVRNLRKGVTKGVKSLLLDLDKRYQQVWCDDSFCHYNLFNDHFFENDDYEIFRTFILHDPRKTVLIIDPPFGGLVGVISKRISTISNMVHDNLAVLLVFPYFNENIIQKDCPSLKMLDYLVNYDNHALYNTNGRKKGSPVRIFTNVSPRKFELMSQLGYWFCKKCLMYRHSNNWHCKRCGTCGSKDGSRYVHCDLCEKCVKPSRVHCHTCNWCVTNDHVCPKLPKAGCHMCGELTHVHQDCPTKGKSNIRKRNLQKFGKVKKKKRRL